jgi:hypothetical protein
VKSSSIHPVPGLNFSLASRLQYLLAHAPVDSKDDSAQECRANSPLARYKTGPALQGLRCK